MPLLGSRGAASSRGFGFQQGGLAPFDLNFKYVTLLLNGNGTNGGQNNTFLDSSNNNFTITRNGNATQGSFSPYGNFWSNYFDGSASNARITFASDTAVPRTGNFTVECWINPVSISSGTIWGQASTASGDNGRFGLFMNSGGILAFSVAEGSGFTMNSNTAVVAGTWYHVAVTKNGSSYVMYLNGNSVATATNSFTLQNGPFRIGALWDGDGVGFQPYTGYVSNLRIVQSVVYSGAFTPPTTNLTAIANTSLLTCQNNRFKDNSTNNFGITIGGSPRVQRFSPFEPSEPSASYDTSVIGGSGYFDGSGDYLSFTANSAFAFGTGDFTIEAWVYPLAAPSGAMNICGTRGEPGSTTAWNWGILNDLSSQMYTNGALVNTGGNSVPLNTWTLISMVRSSGTLKSYINGVEKASTSNSQDFTTTNFWVGITGGTAEPFNGYISNLRLIKGTAITPSVPTAPYVPITNTSLLLNFTNASIPDLAMQNNLETVGNAQISTSVKKFGTGSLAFDGSGDCLFAPSGNQNFSLGATFTIEFWIYNTKTSGFGGVIGHTGTNWYTGIPITYVEGGASTFSINSYAGSLTKSGLSNNTWHHIAIVSENNSAKLYVNGTAESGPLSQAITGTPSYLTIGKHDGTNSIGDFSGYIDDLRITKGLARYTANFTPPNRAYPTY